MSQNKITAEQIQPKEGPFFSSTGTTAAPALRQAGRAFFGDGYDHGQQTDGNVTGGSWLQSFTSTGSITPVISWDYFEDLSRVSSVSNFGIAFSGVSRTAGGNEDAIGVVAAALADAPTAKTVWGAYVDAARTGASTGNVHGAEINAASVGSAQTRGAATPYDDFSTSYMVVGTAIAAGSDAAVFGPSWPISSLLEFRNNGASAYTGINFRNNVLLREGTTPAAGAVGATGYGRAIAMGWQHGLSWYSKDAAIDGQHKESVRVYSDVQNSDVRYEVVFADGSISFDEKEAPGTSLFRINYAADAASYVSVSPGVSGSGPSIAAAGSATNITLTLAPKGSGWVAFNSITNVPEYADDAAAAAGGLNIGGIYRTGSALKVRVA